MGNARSRPGPRPDAGHRPGAAAGLPQAHPVDLQPVFDVAVSRETRHLTSDRARIDVSLDDGAIVAGEEREPICEIEIELVAGEPDDLLAEVQRISDAVDGRLHARTLTDLSYALKTADRKHWSRAAKLNFAPEMTAHDAFRSIVFDAFSHLTANDDCARLNRHIEGVHQRRVALRRTCRSAFRIYRPCCAAGASSRWRSSVRWLGKILGAARDLDVLQIELLDPAIETLGEGKQLAPLLTNLNTRKSAAYAQVGEALSSPRYRHLLIDLCALRHADDLGKAAEDGPGLDQPLAELASHALSRAHRKLLKRGNGFQTLSKPERHEVRIALKRLRYALDFFGGVFESEGKKKFIKRLARLQVDLRPHERRRGGGDDARATGRRRQRWTCHGRAAAGATGLRRWRHSRLASAAGGRNRPAGGRGLERLRQRRAVLGARAEERRVIAPGPLR